MNPISKDGVYDIPIEEYHHFPALCAGPSVSASALSTILLDTPAHYWAFSPYNPKRRIPKRSAALDVGRAAHCLVLGEPEFHKYFFVCPHDKLNSNPGKAWNDEWKAEVAAGREKRTLVRAGDGVSNEPGFGVISDMAAAQRASPQCANAFLKGAPEKSLVWRDKETGIWLKARPDWLPADPTKEWVVEYKTARTIAPRQFGSAAFSFGYHMQAALHVDGVAAVMGVKPLGVAHVVQEKEPPYLAELRMFSPEDIEDGRYEYRVALRRFADCMKRNLWPGYTNSASFITRPKWYDARMEGLKGGDDDGNAGSGTRYTAEDYIGAG